MSPFEYGCVVFIALSCRSTFRRAEKALDKAGAENSYDRMGRNVAFVLAGMASTAHAFCVGVAVWASMGFVVTAWRSVQ